MLFSEMISLQCVIQGYILTVFETDGDPIAEIVDMALENSSNL